MTAGHITKSANGHVDYSNVNTLYVTGGTYTASGDMNLGGLGAQTAATNVLFNTSQTIGKLYIDAASAALAQNGSLSMNVNTLNIVNSGKLDLADNSMLISYGAPDPVATIRSYLSSGYNNGAWNGAGLTSSTAKLDPQHRTGIGYADSADGTGINPTPNSIKLRYTLYGDTTLDRTVDLTDFTFLAASFNQTGTGWTKGDVNYDAKTDLTDFTYLASNFNQSLPGAPAQLQAQGSSSLEADLASPETNATLFSTTAVSAD
jgi:hypothetical protein